MLLLGVTDETRLRPKDTRACDLIKFRAHRRDVREFEVELKKKDRNPDYVVQGGPSQTAYMLHLRGTLASPWNIKARDIFLADHFQGQRPSPKEFREATKRFNTYFWTLRREYLLSRSLEGSGNGAKELRSHRAQRQRKKRVSKPIQFSTLPPHVDWSAALGEAYEDCTTCSRTSPA